MKDIRLFFNYNYSKQKINSLLNKLNKHKLSKIKGNLYSNFPQKEIDELAQYLSEIHSQGIIGGSLPPYNAEWIVNIIQNEDCFHHKQEIIDAVHIMRKVENYQSSVVSENKFLSWNMAASGWVDSYNDGHIGSYIWDLAAILHHIYDPKFSEQFLESYIKYSGNKPSISAVYANLFYMQVIESTSTKNEQNIMNIVIKIQSDQLFDTEVISYETLNRLQMIGYS